MVDRGLGVRSAEGVLCVSMAGGSMSARSVEGRAYVSMVGISDTARNAEAALCVSMAGGRLNARSAKVGSPLCSQQTWYRGECARLF
jgi:hypothetical protein